MYNHFYGLTFHPFDKSSPVKTAFQSRDHLTEFYRHLCMQLGLEPGNRKTEMFKAIQDRVRYLMKEKHKIILVAVDECQYLDTRILRDFKLLMNPADAATVAEALRALYENNYL